MTEQNSTPADDLAPAAAATPGAAAQTPPAGAGTDGGQQPPAGGTKDILDTVLDGEVKPAAPDDVLADADVVKKEGAPDSYTFAAPDGFDPSLLDQGKLDAFMATAKEHGLSQDQFQGVMGYYVEVTQKAAAEAVDAWNDRVDTWRNAAKADKEFGGQQYDANVKTALAAAQKFGDAEFVSLLKSPSKDNPEGLAIGNHPAVLRFLNRIGKAIGDPNMVKSDTETATVSDEARLQRLYPTMFKQTA